MIPLADVVTVTLNPAVDETLIVDSFSVGATNRIHQKETDLGGKGINVSRALAGLGIPTVATGFIGEVNASKFISALENEGVATSFIRCPGETRKNIKVVDQSSDVVTELNDTGFAVPPSALELLWDQMNQLPDRVKWIVLSGSIPPGVPQTIYYDLIHLLKDRGKYVLLDTSGKALTEGIAASPHVIKPNEEEMQQLTAGTESLSSQIERLHREGILYVFLSLGARGAIGSSPGEQIVAIPPSIAPKSTVGAGDAMVAAIVMSLIQGQSLPDILSWGVASGAAAARQNGTGFGTLEEIRRLKKQVKLIPFADYIEGNGCG